MATQFTIRRKILTILGAKFHIYNSTGGLIGYCKQKAFKLKEDIRIYTDESMSEERIAINARSMLDVAAAYDVTESGSGTRIGTLKRLGWKSLLRDEWVVLNESEKEIGKIVEDSSALALIRRFVTNIIPQTFHLKDHTGKDLAELKTHFNPFVHRMTVTVYDNCPLNPYLVLSAGVLMVAIEGRQQ